MARVNKFLYGWALYVNYGQGWEYDVWEATRAEIRARANEYRANCSEYPVRFARRRETNPAYVSLPARL